MLFNANLVLHQYELDFSFYKQTIIKKAENFPNNLTYFCYENKFTLPEFYLITKVIGGINQ